jgi:hypothetical protein
MDEEPLAFQQLRDITQVEAPSSITVRKIVFEMQVDEEVLEYEFPSQRISYSNH